MIDVAIIGAGPDRCDVLIEAEVNVEAVLSCSAAGTSSMPSGAHCIFELPSRAIRPQAFSRLSLSFPNQLKTNHFTGLANGTWRSF
jgi:hypothetical protein